MKNPTSTQAIDCGENLNYHNQSHYCWNMEYNQECGNLKQSGKDNNSAEKVLFAKAKGEVAEDQ